MELLRELMLKAERNQMMTQTLSLHQLEHKNAPDPRQAEWNAQKAAGQWPGWKATAPPPKSVNPPVSSGRPPKMNYDPDDDPWAVGSAVPKRLIRQFCRFMAMFSKERLQLTFHLLLLQWASLDFQNIQLPLWGQNECCHEVRTLSLKEHCKFSTNFATQVKLTVSMFGVSPYFTNGFQTESCQTE